METAHALHRERLERDLAGSDLAKVKQLAEENLELKLRLGLLLRLLISKGVIDAHELRSHGCRGSPHVGKCGAWLLTLRHSVEHSLAAYGQSAQA